MTVILRHPSSAFEQFSSPEELNSGRNIPALLEAIGLAHDLGEGLHERRFGTALRFAFAILADSTKSILSNASIQAVRGQTKTDVQGRNH